MTILLIEPCILQIYIIIYYDIYKKIIIQIINNMYMTKYLDIAMWCAYIFLYIIHGIFFPNNSDWSTNIYTQSFSKSLIILFIEKHMHGNIVDTAMCCAYKVLYSCICSIIYIYIYI